MPKRPPAKPSQFPEAVDWFRERVPIQKPAWKRLNEKAQLKSFTAAGVARLDVLKDVWEAMDKAVQKGESFATFRKRVRASLVQAWGGSEIPGRIENIFRTNIQTAYNAGRRVQLMAPAVRKALPYWTFLPLLDSRTSDICRGIGTVTLPADHEWFRTHTPPLHYQCRSTIVGRSVEYSREAKKKGPAVPPLEGFGHHEGTWDWKPDFSEYPKELVKRYKRER
jgi:SPP1 gp7 family putative phage head morphogenesis protein